MSTRSQPFGRFFWVTDRIIRGVRSHQSREFIVKTVASHLVRHLMFGVAICSLTLFLISAQEAHAFDPQTTCRVRLWFDANFRDPSDYNNTSAGNPPPGSIIPGTNQIEYARFDGSEDVTDLDRFRMRVDNMYFLDGSDWTGFVDNVPSIEFEHIENGAYVPGCDSWTAILYDGKDFTGASVAVTGSLSNLNAIGWNDRVAGFKLIVPAFPYSGSPPSGCTGELYDLHYTGETWGASSHVTPQTYGAGQGAGMISTIRFGGECGATTVTLYDGGSSIDFSNADGSMHWLPEYGWDNRASSWRATFDVAPDPTPRGCILRMFSDNEYTGQSWALAGSQTTGSINANGGAGMISSFAFEGDCGNSEVIFYEGNNWDPNGTKAYARAADGSQHPLWLSDWNDRAQSWTVNFVSGESHRTCRRLYFLRG